MQKLLKSLDLLEWEDAAKICRKCDLCKTRKNVVFGSGNPDAQVMIVGEAPGADEDEKGLPFIGKAGTLLTEIIKACGWKREDVYICNVVKCRPPKNRNPTSEEVSTCRHFLDEQIRIIKPKFILCLGSVASKALVGLTINEARETEFHKYKDIPVLCTYHPAYLLRAPQAKKLVWNDLKPLVKALQDVLGTKKEAVEVGEKHGPGGSPVQDKN